MADNACEHEWRWLDGVHLVLTRAGTFTEYVNAECANCGIRVWAHGRMPAPKHAAIIETPTTGRS